MEARTSADVPRMQRARPAGYWWLTAGAGFLVLGFSMRLLYGLTDEGRFYAPAVIFGALMLTCFGVGIVVHERAKRSS